MTLSVSEVRGRGEKLSSEDVERLFTYVREANGLGPRENNKDHTIVRKVLMDVPKSVSGVGTRDMCRGQLR